VTHTTGPRHELDPARVERWLVDAVDPTVVGITVVPLAGGYSNGAWQITAETADGPRDLVLKAPRPPSIVHRFDPNREATALDALGRRGAPVPRVRAISRDDAIADGPCFVMDRVPGRSVDDTVPAGYHSPGWFRDADPESRRAIWESFHDRLAELHATDVDGLDVLRHGDDGMRGVLHYWRDAILDVVHAEQAPRQLAALDWLTEHLPTGADDAPAACMGDARLVNGIVERDRVNALVDFEVVYLGNPAADLAYSLFLDQNHRAGSDAPLDDLPDAEDTWTRWGGATGRATTDRGYWTAFGATIIVVTATRAIVQWGGPDAAANYTEQQNALIDAWEAAIAGACR
jgi:aminoglycoside phosphotransferase (APT) family kinase protein